MKTVDKKTNKQAAEHLLSFFDKLGEKIGTEADMEEEGLEIHQYIGSASVSADMHMADWHWPIGK